MLILEIAAGIVIGGLVLLFLSFVFELGETLDTGMGCLFAFVALALFVGLGFLAAKFLFCSDCVLHVTL